MTFDLENRQDFDSCCKFLQTFILAAYLCKFLFRLHICANYLAAYFCKFADISETLTDRAKRVFLFRPLLC